MLRRKGVGIAVGAILIGLIISGIYGFTVRGNDEAASANVDDHVSASLDLRDKEGMKSAGGVSYEITPSLFIAPSDFPLLSGEAAHGHPGGAIHLKKGDSFDAEITVAEKGSYALSFDYFLLTDGLQSTEYSIQVNGESPDGGAGRFVLPPLWKNVSDEFPRDRFGNEVMPSQRRAEEWLTATWADSNPLNPDPLMVRLNEGKNKIRVTVANGELLGGKITVSMPGGLPSYREYAEQNGGRKPVESTLIVLEAEKSDYKNDTTINPLPSRDQGVVPYDTNLLLLNTLGGKTWKQSGQTVYYDITAEQEGLYQIGFKYKQYDQPNTPVFRTITIDGRIPFAELRSYPFPFTSSWKTEVLRGEDAPYRIYLSKGKHRIGIMADASPYFETVQLLHDSINRANALNLEIRKLVGNDVDRNRDWEITEYLPNVQADLTAISKALGEEYRNVLRLNGGVESSKAMTAIRMAIRSLDKLAADPNSIPRKLGELNGGSGSVTQNLSNAITDFESQPLTIDQIYVSDPDAEYPDYRSAWYKPYVENVKRFFHSFSSSSNDNGGEGTTLTVWLNRPRSYMDLLQRMVDEQFTPKTGIKVNFSTIPNEQRLTLAAASGVAPDLALGISNGIPFDLGVRGAALDLRQFDDFGKTIAPFSPGSLLPLIVNDKVYGLPETQDFYVLFYRKDILDSLGLPIPDTWTDVIEMMPELQRYGMNFYSPMAGASGIKQFMFTAPFLYQAGGDIFGKDAFETGIDGKESLEGIQLMTDLFKLYGLPMQIPTFYEHFRTGKLPIGVSNFTTYIQMQVAAPELKGAWKIAPAPGVEHNGVTERWNPGSAQVSMIFKETKHPEESWTFLKWWLSTETQVNFANQLQTLFGKEYLWNSANLEAFSQAFWPEEDKKAILEQWKWLKEVPKTPSSYMVERILSNIWTQVVFDEKNIRSTVEDAVIEIDKETVRKMEEFGYMDKGKVVNPYPVPTIEEVESWVKGKDGK